MEARELRIGNWVHVSDDGHGNAYDEQCTASHIDYLVNGGTNIDPIPLTEGWLVAAFGFTKHLLHESGCLYRLEHDEFILEYFDDFSCTILGHDSDLGVAPDFPVLRYVHQLQNLYFALTGEEL